MPKCQAGNCTVKHASFNYRGEKGGVRCKGHKEVTMVDVTHSLCESCDKRACFNYLGSKKGIRCVAHKEPKMIDVTHNLCEKCGTRATFNYKGFKKGIRCELHKEDNMVNVTDAKCQKCDTIPTFNYKGLKKGIRCEAHKEDNMVNVTDRKCQKCDTIPSFNYEGLNKGIRCDFHKKKGMINVTHEKCKHISGCKKAPSYNLKGENPLYCFKHKQDGMINVVTPRCISSLGCDTIPVFNYVDQKKGLYCKEHKLDGMVNVVTPKCQDPSGCDTTAGFNYKGQKKGLYCSQHKLPHMINVRHGKCEFCELRTSFGFPHQKPTRCADHKEPNMISNPTKRCTHLDLKTKKKCKEMAIHGYTSHIVCDDHKAADMINFLERKCTSCGYINVISSETNQCADCDECFTIKIMKGKEMEIKNFLETNGFKFISHDKRIKESTLLSRPDFIFLSRCGRFYIILEVDEYQHVRYEKSCERVRMINISKELDKYSRQCEGMSKPCVFIRYNPDDYTCVVSGRNRKHNPSQGVRRKVLGSWLTNLINMDYEEMKSHGSLSYVPLYYDNFNEKEAQLITIETE